ncbi:MAG: hypothetical protein ACYC23_18240 [Limisphaerales bacterium]
MQDLVLLVADKNAHFALKGALGRPEALGIRRINFEFRVHPGRDGGGRKTGPELLALERRRFHHALLVLDFEGCGTDLPNATALEAQLDTRLFAHWKEAARSIVIEPELDVWIWGSNNAVEQAIGWPAGKGLREWLNQNGFTFEGNAKPTRPKESLEAALRACTKSHFRFVLARRRSMSGIMVM